MTASSRSTTTTGLLMALGCYGAWGAFPAFWKLLSGIPATEVLAYRILWSLVTVTLPVLLVPHRRTAIWAVLSSRRRLLILGTTSALISFNWGLFIWAVSNGHVLESSLGYFLNPLVNIALGVALLGERLRPLQTLAVALAVIGVGIMAVSLGTMPWVPLALALSFGFYGLLRKTTPVDPISGLAVETALIAPLAILYLIIAPSPSFGWIQHVLLAAGGPLTAVPLVLFAAAAVRLPLSSLGMLQYITPSGHFLLAILAYGEPLTSTHIITFSFIWTALLITAADGIRARLRT